MKSLLVIGGSGFFGKSFLDAYKHGILIPWDISSVLIVARNATYLNGAHPELMDDSVTLIDSDISRCDILPVADFVIHAAASTDASQYLSQPELEKKNIQAGTNNYCDLAQKYHRNSQIVYCSSGAVYGQQPSDIFRTPEEFDGGLIEEFPPGKRDYAAAKRDAELAIKGLCNAGLSVSIARCFAFIGPYLPRNQHFAIGNFIEDGMSGRPIKVTAGYPVFRSYMHADDLVIWLMSIAAAGNSGCPVFNVGSDEEIEIHSLAERIAKRFYVPMHVQPFSFSEVNFDRYIPNIQKAKDELGLSIKLGLEEALELTIQQILALK